jgi:plastocyanin
MNAGATYTYTFTVPGTYQYGCQYHSWMVGNVTVIQGK